MIRFFSLSNRLTVFHEYLKVKKYVNICVCQMMTLSVIKQLSNFVSVPLLGPQPHGWILSRPQSAGGSDVPGKDTGNVF